VKPKSPRAPEIVSAPVEATDPLADYVYSGWVKHDGVITALIENAKTREGTYLSVGDQFDEFGVVAEIGDETVTLRSAGKLRIVKRPGEYSLIPLNANAAYLRKEAAPAPGGPPNGAPNLAGPGQPGMQTFTPPGGQRFQGGPGFPPPGGFPGAPAGFAVPSGGFQDRPMLFIQDRQ